MSAADLTVGYFGKIPATGDFVAWNLPRIFIDRWDRWMSMELGARPDEGELDSRVWRFAIKAGIFGDQPCAGAWRMSEDRVGRRYPFAIVALGATPEAGDAWYDAVAAIASKAIADFRDQAWIMQKLQALPMPKVFGKPDRIAFWRDDWEVNELGFADIYDLAGAGLPAMRAARS